MSDNTRNWILKEVLPLVVVVGGSVGGSVLWITSELGDLRNEVADLRSGLSEEIADVRSDLSEEFTDVRSELAGVRERVASVEGKLDLLISGLDIQVSVAAVPDRPDQPASSR